MVKQPRSAQSRILLYSVGFQTRPITHVFVRRWDIEVDCCVNSEAEGNAAPVENTLRSAVTRLRDPSWGMDFLKGCEVGEQWHGRTDTM
jgi:hypothetical protein